MRKFSTYFLLVENLLGEVTTKIKSAIQDIIKAVLRLLSARIFEISNELSIKSLYCL